MLGPAAPTAGPAGRVLAMREIKRLQHLWCHLIEAGAWDDAARLFTQDAGWSDGERQAAGHRELAALFAGRAGLEGPLAGRFEFRPMLSPVITLSPDGERARGRWREICMAGQAGVQAHWSGGISIVDYARVDGRWLIAAVRHHRQFAGPCEGGWRHIAREVPPVPFHFSPLEAGAPFGAVPMHETEAGDGTLARLLVSAGEVQNLVAAFGFYADRRMHEDLADLFCEDGCLSVEGSSCARGRDAILALLSELFGPPGLDHGDLNDRLQLVPVVTLAADGGSASVRAYEIGMSGRHGGEALWSVTIQQLLCRPTTDGCWKIEALTRIPRLHADHEAGWKEPRKTPGPCGYPIAPSPTPEAGPTLIERAPTAEPTVPFCDEATILAARAAAFDCGENAANAYGYYIDEYMWDEAADLFAAAGWKELSYIGTYIGRERIRQSMKARYGTSGRRPSFMALHQTVQPYVTVASDGLSARLRMRLFQFNSQAEAEGSWILGVYENQMLFEDGGWRIHGMDLEYCWLGDYCGGWSGIVAGSSERFRPDPEAIAAFPPDAPLRGETFAPFPRIAPLGFHFINPVSGRLPERLLPWSDGHHAGT